MGATLWLQVVGLLVLSNLFMTLAWYGHLRHFLRGRSTSSSVPDGP